MAKLFLKLFVKNYEDVNDTAVRGKYGELSGFVGIALNTVLCIVKFIIGSISGSIAVTADAINNLSDVGSSAVNVIGFKLSSKPADEDHPFGHGRIEYITAIVVAFLILIMGVELGKSSVEKIISNSPIIFSWPSFIALALSIFAKLWLGLFNRDLGRRIDSKALKAIVKDSFSDMLTTFATMVSLVVAHIFNVNIDGYIGLVVTVIVILAGIGVLRDSLSPLLGQPANPELAEKIEKTILNYDEIIKGTHDLMLHDYGPNRGFASAHVEVPSNCDIMYAHDVIDMIECEVMKKYGIHLVLHMDPIDTDNELANKLRAEIGNLVKKIDPDFTIHDFRIVSGPTHTNLVFDLVVDYDLKKSRSELTAIVKEEINKELGDKYIPVINCEYSYVGKKQGK